jgi:hypothetical protein
MKKLLFALFVLMFSQDAKAQWIVYPQQQYYYYPQQYILTYPQQYILTYPQQQYQILINQQPYPNPLQYVQWQPMYIPILRLQ